MDAYTLASMTQSEVAATEARAPKKGGWRRPAWIAAALVIPIAAILFSPQRSAAYTTPGGHEITDVVLGHSTALQFREDAARGSYVIAALQPEVRRTGLCALHPRFCQYRGLYRQVGFPFLVLSVIAFPCWLVFRMYRRRTLGRPVSVRREILLLTVVGYLVCLATLTLTPNRSSRLRAEGTGGIELHPNVATLTCSSALLPRAPNARTFCVQNLAGNVALFFPLGVLIPLVGSHRRFWRGLQIAIALSVGIELIQYLSSAWGSHRSADVNDVILNVLGAGLGLAAVSMLRLRQGTRAAVQRA